MTEGEIGNEERQRIKDRNIGIKRSRKGYEPKGEKDKITRYVTVSEINKGYADTEMSKEMEPLENNWEMAMRIKEIIAENNEKWKVFQKEKDEINEKRIQKKRRFEMMQEKKRKWYDRKGDKMSKETFKKQMKRMEHYEMWWNTWERRRGNRSTLEKSIEEKERVKGEHSCKKMKR